MAGFKSSLGYGGSKAVRTNSIKQGGGDHSAQKTGNQGAQNPGPNFKLKAPPSIVGGMRGGTDGKVVLKPISEASSTRK